MPKYSFLHRYEKVKNSLLGHRISPLSISTSGGYFTLEENDTGTVCRLIVDSVTISYAKIKEKLRAFAARNKNDFLYGVQINGLPFICGTSPKGIEQLKCFFAFEQTAAEIGHPPRGTELNELEEVFKILETIELFWLTYFWRILPIYWPTNQTIEQNKNELKRLLPNLHSKIKQVEIPLPVNKVVIVTPPCTQPVYIKPNVVVDLPDVSVIDTLIVTIMFKQKYVMVLSHLVEQTDELSYIKGMEKEFGLEICSKCSRAHLVGVDGICTKCLKIRPELLKIQEYNTKATRFFSFKTTKKVPTNWKPVYLGVELELEGVNDKNVCQAGLLMKDHCIMKRDGSLDNGVEFASAPATIEVHEKEFSKFFEKIPDGLCAKSTCGMHVHVNKDSLTKLQIGRILAFVNNEENKSFIASIAERSNNSYARSQRDIGVTHLMYSNTTEHGKYSVVNLLPPQTIEFRIFKSTTSFSNFMKNLEFVQALVDYTRPAAIPIPIKESLKYEEFLKFVRNNRKSYISLDNFLVGSGYLPAIKGKDQKKCV